ncbi:MAG: phosphate ABC transporter permease subunit PstC [Bacteroidota bacterium]
MNIIRIYKEKANKIIMIISLILVILLPVFIGIGLFYKSSFILSNNSISDLIFSTEWKPLSGKFGLFTFIISSLLVTFLAILISGPICLLTAIYLTQYAKSRILKFMHPIIDILSGIPSVIFGVWGILIIVPFVSDYLAPVFGKDVSGYSIISAGIVLAIMIIPFILNILIEIFNTIPEELTEISLSVGASKWQTVKFVIVKKAFSGIISAFGLGISRAFGETIAVVMVVGCMVKLPESLFDPGYPLPALIINNYGEMLSIPMYDSALMLAASVLFIIVIIFNIVSRIAISRSEAII